MPKHRRNPPPPPPRRRSSDQRVQTDLARVRRIAGQVTERERPFDPRKRGDWRGSSRDLVVNGRRSLKMSDGYAYQLADTGDFSSWEDSIDDDWDTEMVTKSEASGARLVGEKTIDGARCYVFESGDKTTYWAQVKHMVRNGDVDPRDIPAHLRPAELNSIPEENGENIGYSQGYRSKVEPGWYQVEYATGSDYSGGGVHESNYRVLSEMLEESHPAGAEPVVWARTPGGHGTYGIVVRYGDLDEEIREAIDGLEDYPLLNEEDHSELEIEQQNEAWENWAKSDFIKECAKYLEVDPYELGEQAEAAGVDWFVIFRAAEEKANVYWEDQQGAGQWINVKRVADTATDFIGGAEFPSWVDADTVDQYEKLSAVVGELQE